MKMSRSGSLALAVSVLAVTACAAAQAPPAASPAAMTEDEKTFYALGLMLGRNLSGFNLSAAELETVNKGLADAANGRTSQVDLQTYGPKVQQLSRTRTAARAEAEKAKAAPFLEAAGKEPGATTTPSGLVFRTLTPGTGDSPAATDTVKVHYHGTLTDGTVFDSSVQRNQPAEFPLNGVIPCWTEGVQKMKVGEKAKLVCPSSIAYGDQGRPPQIPPGATLIFEVELLGATPKPAAAVRPPGAAPVPPAPAASPVAPAPRPSPPAAAAPPPAASPAPSPSPVPR
jgi:FKBP-type peptidyl-prolyl cis-trans isomerase FkpA